MKSSSDVQAKVCVLRFFHGSSHSLEGIFPQLKRSNSSLKFFHASSASMYSLRQTSTVFRICHFSFSPSTLAYLISSEISSSSIPPQRYADCACSKYDSRQNGNPHLALNSQHEVVAALASVTTVVEPNESSTEERLSGAY